MENKQTAVEWLESKFQKFILYYEGNHKAELYTIQELSNDFEQAKAMEREQRFEDFKQGFHSAFESLEAANNSVQSKTFKSE